MIIQFLISSRPNFPVNTNLTFPDGVGFYPDVQDGKRGYNTEAARGADTFVPFSGETKLIAWGRAELNYPYMNYRDYDSEYCDITTGTSNPLVVTFKKDCSGFIGLGSHTSSPTTTGDISLSTIQNTLQTYQSTLFTFHASKGSTISFTITSKLGGFEIIGS